MRLYYIAPRYDGDAADVKVDYAEGNFYDEGAMAIDGIAGVYADKATAERRITNRKEEKVVSVDVLNAKLPGQVFEVTAQSEDGGATFGLFGTRAAAKLFADAKLRELAGFGGDDDEGGGEDEECMTRTIVRAHKVVGTAPAAAPLAAAAPARPLAAKAAVIDLTADDA